jgi:pSer/pThr/pTyr-binding forkhead associated (FHA) protein
MIFQIQAGKNGKKEIRVDEDVCYVGSDSSCHIFIKHSSISGKHLKVEQEGYKLFVTDISDSNTVVINNYTLDHKKKTVYHGNSPIQIGPGIFISITPREVNHFSQNEDEEEKAPKSSLEKYEKTNSKIRKNPMLESAKVEKAQGKSKEQEKSNKKAVALFLGIIGLSYFYFQEEELRPEESIVETQNSTKKSTKVSLPKTDLRDLFNGSLCENPQEKSLCTTIYQNIEAKEGVKITEEGVFVFLKLDSHLNANNKIKLFESYTDDKKLKYTLASLVLKELILKAIPQELVIHAIGFDTFSDIPILRAYLKIERNSNFQFNDEDLKVIHSYSINAGMPNYFEDYLADFVSFRRVQ